MRPRITIGMAVSNDFEGLWATVQSACLHNEWDDPNDLQIVIVDNSPAESDCSKLISDFIGWGGHKEGRTSNIKYIRIADIPSTTIPREIAIKEADAPFVCIVDCHVLLPINGFKKLLNWFESNPEFNGLLHGPILYDNLHKIDTAFADQFRGGMWGTWSNTWYCPNKDLYFCIEPEEVTDENRPRQPNKDGLCSFRDVITLEEIFIESNIKYAGHEKTLKGLGYVEAGRLNDGTPFGIPGQGMGLFATVKKHWMGFDTRCKGFGGEELNIHTKYREADREVLCLPFLKWNHRFGRQGGAPYPNTNIAKVRNYVLWADSHKDKQKQLNRIYKHFVKSGMVSVEQWNNLLLDPANYPIDLTPPSQKNKNEIEALDKLFLRVSENDPDMKGYAEIVRDIVSNSSIKNVTAIVKRCSWEPVLAAGFPQQLNVYQYQENHYIKETHEAHKLQDNKNGRVLTSYSTHKITNPAYEVNSIPGDILFIDHINESEYIYKTLESKFDKYKLIAVRGTQTFGEKAEGVEGLGLWDGMKKFLSNHPEWFVSKHWSHNYGMTLLSRLSEMRPQKRAEPWPKGFGPGTELKAILMSVGIQQKENCGCRAMLLEMDNLGPEGCLKDFDRIVNTIKERAESWGWNSIVTSDDPNAMSLGEKLRAAYNAVKTGLVFKVNWANPFPDLIQMAINNAKENGNI
jgi:hypothetical protein